LFRPDVRLRLGTHHHVRLFCHRFQDGIGSQSKVDSFVSASQVTKTLKDGRPRMTLAVADSRELVGWILSFGSGLRVVRPDSLHAAVKQEAQNILEGS
jgi:predicted DNA-binding transcriptional regulator YafY